MTEPVLSPAAAQLTPGDIRRTITPLRLIFWGALCCIFNFNYSHTVNGSGFRFEFPGHALGMILIIVGLFRLAPLPVSRLYTFVLRLAQVVAVLALVDAVRKHIILPDQPPLVDSFFAFVGGASIIAAVLFCVAMICSAAPPAFSGPGPARSWRTTTILLILVYVLSLGFVYVAALFCFISSWLSPINLSLIGPLAGLMFLAWLAPLIHFYVSTSRMKHAAEAAAEPDLTLGGYEIRQPGSQGVVLAIVLAILAGLALPPVSAQLVASVTAHHLPVPGLRSSRLEDGLVTLGGAQANTADWYVDNSVGSNEFDEVRVVAIRYLTDPVVVERNHRKGFDSQAPLAGLRSEVRVETSYPADESKSGLWIDGVKKPFVKPFTVIYVSDKYPATDVPIPDADRQAFLQDVEHLDPNAMIEKWIRPRLAPSPKM